MSLGRTSNPECGPTFPGMAFPPAVSTDRLPAGQRAERGQKQRSLRAQLGSCPSGGLGPVCWHLGLRMKGWSMGAGRGGGVGLEYIVSQDSL